MLGAYVHVGVDAHGDGAGDVSRYLLHDLGMYARLPTSGRGSLLLCLPRRKA